MVCNIGDELGTREKHELTSRTARVRVAIDGLKPLVKETIIEFDSGEEARITLEYKRLENHCSFCQRLSHLSSHCPTRREAESITKRLGSEYRRMRYPNTTKKNPHIRVAKSKRQS
ncbi:Zinc knuckle CX2CX4HX4C protein [Raphanus sativus]|nr:Zinc knuckle CX2CX4HX4C protein [Raphanus sativus]